MAPAAWQTFWKITFPLLRPGHYFVATVAVIGALQLFDQAAIAGGTERRPEQRADDVVLYLYNAAFAQFELRLCGGRRRDPVRRHLHGHAGPAAAVRAGPVVVSDGRMTAAAARTPTVPPPAATASRPAGGRSPLARDGSRTRC